MEMEYCFGSGKRYRRLDGPGTVPRCPECGQSWIRIGALTEPAVPGGASTPMHDRPVSKD